MNIRKLDNIGFVGGRSTTKADKVAFVSYFTNKKNTSVKVAAKNAKVKK